jgi:DNA primase
MQDPVAEIKSKLDVMDVVAPYVHLKKAGKYMKACCPFHKEKTPSFFVSPERQLAYCFSCQKGGDVFQFIQDIEGVDFRGALEILAEKANVELPKHSGGPKVSKDVKARLKAVNTETCKFLVHQLWETEDGKKVLQYLRARSIEDETTKTFQVGFAPGDASGKFGGKDILYRHLLEKKHAKGDILESSVCVARDSASERVNDRFWLRLMFPLDSVQGDIIAFNGRALRKDMNPKYTNSPEYVLYNKGRMLYNLSRAKKHVKEEDLAVCVEGQFDVMASWQVGVRNVVATSGTALTAEQFKLLKRYTKRVALAFDCDSAGQDALQRAVNVAQPLGLELFVIEIPSGKDTADAVKEDPQLWLDAVEARRPYLEFFEDKWKQDCDLETSSGKKEFSDRMLELLVGVKHPVEQDHYVKRLSKFVGTPVDMLYDYLKKIKSGGRRQRSVKKVEEKVSVSRKSKQDRLIEYFLGMVLAFPRVFFPTWEKAKDFSVFSEHAQELGLVKQMNRLDEAKFVTFYKSLPEKLTLSGSDFDATSVYKQIEDHYNLHAEVDEVFYSSVESAGLLQKMAFEAELKNPDHGLVQKEFEKLITLLYFELSS